MSRVYSTRLLVVHNLVEVATYTVPDGFIAVVRDIDGYASAGLIQTVVTVYGNLSQVIDWWVIDTDTTVVHQWRGRQVLYAGEQLQVLTTGPADITISGYELVAP